MLEEEQELEQEQEQAEKRRRVRERGKEKRKARHHQHTCDALSLKSILKKLSKHYLNILIMFIGPAQSMLSKSTKTVNSTAITSLRVHEFLKL